MAFIRHRGKTYSVVYKILDEMEKNIQHLKHLLRRKKQINGKKKLSTSSLSENLRFKSVQH